MTSRLQHRAILTLCLTGLLTTRVAFGQEPAAATSAPKSPAPAVGEAAKTEAPSSEAQAGKAPAQEASSVKMVHVEDAPAKEPNDDAPAKGQSKETPADEPITKKGIREHDGLYLRVGLGGGYLDVHSRFAGYKFSLSGGAMGVDLMIGGTPSPGLVVGGGYWLSSVSSPNVELDGESSTASGTLDFGLIGPFIDFFPNPKGGFHAGGLLGIAMLSAADSSGSTQGEDEGFGGGLFAGYDVWIADQWSLGGSVRAGMGSISSEGETFTPMNIEVMFTGLYH